MVAIASPERDVILDAVRRMYSDVAREPQREFHFPTGRRACEFVGYPANDLDALPTTAVESFAGVGYPFAADVLRAGDAVLDVGSGSGTDVLIASRIVGEAGRVFGLDMTAAMRAKLRANVAVAGLRNVTILEGNAEAIPLPDACVDSVTTNGVLNLVPDKRKAIAEVARVLRRGGMLQLADIVVESLPSDACRSHPELWAECIVGATSLDSYLDMLAGVGFGDIEVLHRLDYFSASSSGETQKVAASFGAHSVVLRASRT